MAKLRHIAIRVDDLEASARFYEEIFEMKRVHAHATGIYLSDGLMNLAILSMASKPPGAEPNDLKHGTEHFGFRVDDFETTELALKAAGATYAFEIGDPSSTNYERKWRGPEGVLFDISEKGWYVTTPDETPEGNERDPS